MHGETAMTQRIVLLAMFFGTALALQGLSWDRSPDLPDDLWKVPLPKALGDPLRPRMLAARGCSGSTAIVGFARNLLRMHGIPVPRGRLPDHDEHGRPLKPKFGYPAELLSPHINFFYDDAGGDIGHALELAYDDLSVRNTTLFFKGMIQYLQATDLGHDAWVSVKPVFERLKPLVVLIPRRNVLDQIVCQIRDCLNSAAGVPVDNATGQESQLCFARRAEDHKVSGGLDGYMAHVRAGVLQQYMSRENKMMDRVRTNIKGIGIDAPTIFSEDLLDFQTPVESGFARGVAAWEELLLALGVQPDVELIKDYLWRNRNSYHMPHPHREVIYNFDEVVEALKGTEYEGFIRA